jgi:hypothetical protein
LVERCGRRWKLISQQLNDFIESECRNWWLFMATLKRARYSRIVTHEIWEAMSVFWDLLISQVQYSEGHSWFLGKVVSINCDSHVILALLLLKVLKSAPDLWEPVYVKKAHQEMRTGPLLRLHLCRNSGYSFCRCYLLKISKFLAIFQYEFESPLFVCGSCQVSLHLYFLVEPICYEILQFKQLAQRPSSATVSMTRIEQVYQNIFALCNNGESRHYHDGSHQHDRRRTRSMTGNWSSWISFRVHICHWIRILVGHPKKTGRTLQTNFAF